MFGSGGVEEVWLVIAEHCRIFLCFNCLCKPFGSYALNFICFVF